MMAGAAVAAVVAVLLIETIRVMGRVEPGAAMGVVFTTMFAAASCFWSNRLQERPSRCRTRAVTGNLESLIWLDAQDWGSLLDPAALAGLPPQLGRLAVVTLGGPLRGTSGRNSSSTFDAGFPTWSGSGRSSSASRSS